jgi:hypothetical protein
VETVKTALSTRAQHSIHAAIYGWLTLDREELRVEVGGMTRSAVRERLHAAAKERYGGDIHRLLMVTKNCGAVTAHEITKWLDLYANDEKPHTCVCRTCGRTLPLDNAPSTRHE